MNQVAGWFPDPWGRAQSRYFDGEKWTENVATDGVASNDAAALSLTPPAGPTPFPTSGQGAMRPTARKRKRWPWAVAAVIALIGVGAATSGGKKAKDTASATSETSSAASAAASTSKSSAATSTAEPASSSTSTAATETTAGSAGNEAADLGEILLGEADAIGARYATVVVTNHSSKVSNYLIELAVESADGAKQLDTTVVTVRNLSPGQSATAKSLPITADLPADAKVKLKKADRSAAVSNGSTDATADVAGVQLGEPDALGFRYVTLTVMNHSSKSSNYVIEVAVESADGATQIATTTAAVNNLDPGQTAEAKGLPLSEDVPADAKVVVKQVTRYAA